MVVTYRSHRETLKDSLLTKNVFNNFDSFLNYVLDETRLYFPNVIYCKSDVSFIFNSSSDYRCGWYNIYTVCVNNCAIGFCTFSDVENGKDVEWILKH